jgi:lysophospholipase L1-like esterase
MWALPRWVALGAAMVGACTVQAALAAPAGPLGTFYADLGRLEQHRLQHVSIVQLGDSHTAGDLFTGELRKVLQTRFGDAGRGTVAAGRPYVGARWAELTVTETGRWKVLNSLKAPGAAAYGIAGFQSASASSTATMTATMTDQGWFDHCTVDFVHSPIGGSLELRVDGQTRSTVSTRGPGGTPGRIILDVPHARQLSIIAHGRDVRISDWGFQRDTPGLILNSFGVVGATAGIVTEWNATEVAATLRALHPSLIVVEYGTNEGHELSINTEAYARTFAASLELLHNLAPGASVLVIGPPDSERNDAHCRHARCAWYRPGALADVRRIQKQLALGQGAAFWSWEDVMRPEGGMAAWVSARPPLARTDHVHLMPEGYRRSADALFAWMMRGYSSWKRDNAVPNP